MGDEYEKLNAELARVGQHARELFPESSSLHEVSLMIGLDAVCTSCGHDPYDEVVACCTELNKQGVEGSMGGPLNPDIDTDDVLRDHLGWFDGWDENDESLHWLCPTCYKKAIEGK